MTITPENGRFSFSFRFEVNADIPDLPEGSVRIAAVDFGVENLMAVANNCGLPCLIYKGGAAKAVNQLYNKTISAIVSRQTLETGKKFVPTPEYKSRSARKEMPRSTVSPADVPAVVYTVQQTAQ